MGKLVFGMMQSLDGYVDGAEGRLELPPPGVALGRHFTDHVRGLAGALYGRRIYEIMRYWDEDRPEWDAGDHEFARPPLRIIASDRIGEDAVRLTCVPA